jgi:hypothetical protein
MEHFLDTISANVRQAKALQGTNIMALLLGPSVKND